MKKLILPLVAVCLLAGCMSASVPKLTFRVNPKTGEVTFSNPKDTTVTGFSATISKDGTGTIMWSNMTTTMNPDVITTTGAAQAAMLKGASDAVASAVVTGMKAAVTK